MTWHCTSCPETGTTQASAERHTKGEHATVTHVAEWAESTVARLRTPMVLRGAA